MQETYTVPVAEADRIKAGLAIHLVAARTGASAGRMARPGRSSRLDPRTCRARWLAMYLAHISFGWTLERVGHVFGLNRATAGTACRWAEDERDRAAIDDLLSQLEALIQSLYAQPRCELSQ